MLKVEKINKRRPVMLGVIALLAVCGIKLAQVFPSIGWTSMLPVANAQPQYDASLYSGLRWRMIGPFRGGRVNAVSGVIGQPNTFYFGSVGGGVWKSTNQSKKYSVDR